AGVPNPGQHIRDGICQVHTSSFPLPAGLAHARDFPLQGELTETDTTESELPQHRAGASAPLTAAHAPDLELGCALGSFNPGSFCHLNSSKVRGERGEVRGLPLPTSSFSL